MQDFDTTTDDGATSTAENEGTRENKREKFRLFAKSTLKRFLLFISFGPGVLGFLWLLGRILKR